MEHKWTYEIAFAKISIPLFDLIEEAHHVHKKNFPANTIQVNTLLSLQTGGCSEDCAYCAQSIRNGVKSEKTPMLTLEEVIQSAKKAKAQGSTRFCMGTSGRCQGGANFTKICEIVSAVKKIGLETCLTIGMLTKEQATQLKASGLDYYNHNVDTSIEHYQNIITTRNMDDRINTINIVCKAGINLCSGGIIGIGETAEDRVKMLVLLANLETQPQSIPINKLVKVPGTKLENTPDVDVFDFVRVIALTRIMFPKSYVKLSAGRESMSDELQALCYYAGANSIFSGDKLLTVKNAGASKDTELFRKLNIKYETIL